MLHLGKGRLCYSLARRLDISYLTWKGLSVLSASSKSPRCLQPTQVQLPTHPQDILTSRLLPQLSPLNHATPTGHVIQKRQISFETYEKYYSPDSPPIALLMYYLNSVHDLTGLPWFISLGICTIFLRLVIALPFRIIQKRNMNKNIQMRGYTRALIESLTYRVQLEAEEKRWSEREQLRVLSKRINEAVRAARQSSGADPRKTAIYPMLQIPVWLSMSFALRNMAGYRVLGVEAVLYNPEMVREGALWFSNLLVPDPTFIIPLITGSMHLINNEVNTRHLPKGLGTSVIKWFGRGASLAFVPFGCIVPSAISLYWAYSAFTAVIVSVILNMKRCRTYFQLDFPYQEQQAYLHYRAVLEKETGVIVPQQEEEKKRGMFDKIKGWLTLRPIRDRFKKSSKN